MIIATPLLFNYLVKRCAIPSGGACEGTARLLGRMPRSPAVDEKQLGDQDLN